MARGITEEDVFRACDALLIAGERPTIERVRKHLGTGSPNTVGPHLDSWFKGLGARIVDPAAFAAQSAIPDGVVQAAKYFWERAQAEARGDFDERVRAGLADAVANVEAEKERARIADAAAFEAASRTARLQSDLEQALATAGHEQLARTAAEAQMEELRLQISALREQADQTRLQLQRAQESFSADLASARDATTVAERRADAANRRALQEVDDARQAARKTERQRDQLHVELATASERLRAADVEHAGAAAQLQARIEGMHSDQASLLKQAEAMGNDLAVTRRELAQSRQESGASRAEAQALREVVAQMSASIRAISATPARKRAGSRPGN